MPDSIAIVTDPFARFQDWLAEAWVHEPGVRSRQHGAGSSA